jgi:DMSO reductase anchor subunit
VSLAHEWSLAAFTLAVAGLAAFAARAALGWGGLSPIAFAGAAAGAMALGALHLGRKERAWRAILNLRTSWLAREIAAFALFAIVATGWSAWRVPAGAVGRGAVLATAALALFAVDRVYRYAQLAPRARPHSGVMFPAAGFLLGLLSGRGDVALAAGGLQFALYARRHLAARGASRRPWWLVALRAGVGLALPLALWGVPGDGPRVVAVAAGIAGLAVDRAEFYLDLGFRSPQRQMADDLARRLAGAPARG